MKLFSILKRRWQSIVIALLLITLIGGVPGAAIADTIKIQALPSLDDLTDVNATLPDNQDVLTWDNDLSEWINAPPATVAAANQTGRSVTYTVAAPAAPDLIKTQADYVCDGIDDQIEIQDALDALPDGGGWVACSGGTFNFSDSASLASNQWLSGCGRSTIFTTSTPNLIFLSAVGSEGSEKTGIVISDLQIDGGAGAVGYCGIYFEYVDYSLIRNTYLTRFLIGEGAGCIYFQNSDFNCITNNVCRDNTSVIIYLSSSCKNTISGNICQENTDDGIELVNSNNNAILGNNCQGNIGGYGISIFGNDNTITGNVCNDNNGGIGLSGINNTISGNTCNTNTVEGIIVSGNYNTIVGNTCNANTGKGIHLGDTHDNTVNGNTCQGNGEEGIYLISSFNNLVLGNTCSENNLDGIGIIELSNNNNIVGNICLANSQSANNTYSDIFVDSSSDYNNIQGNTCRAGSLTNKPKYGIYIEDASCIENKVLNNDLYDDGFGTAPYNDAGTDTIYVEPSDTEDAIAKKHDQNTDTDLGALPTKNPPVDDDLIVQRDSTDAWTLFTSTWAEIKSFLKTYFDTLYASISDFNALSSTVSTHTTQIADLSGNMSAVWIDIGDLQTDLGIAQGDISDLESDMSDAQGDIIDLTGNVTGLKTIGIEFGVDGGASAITTGVKRHLEIPFDCTVISWTIMSDVAGAIQIDVWKDTYANFPPTDADSMCSGKEPKIVATNQKNQDLDISDWTTTSISAGDILAFNVDSCTTITKVTLTITAVRVI